ncbi:large T antigen [Trichonephila clavata]|uniref:Large T antigen n=1 Tax=Trichonephila clavata TaxID=2740835 RepID=A0A8X6G7F5_TRICU|nr:large T antigen [Trichonephila clavata]
MDDVRGHKSEAKDKMSEGNGFSNLDNMRTHLDGTMPVQIEKINEKPVNIHFPPGLITCNDYVIPDAVKERVKFFHFTFITGTKPEVRDHIIDLKCKWWREHNGVCKCHFKEDEGAAAKNDAASPAKENEAPPKNNAASPADENEAPPKNDSASPAEESTA